jgi:hypothetical protein
MKMLSKAMTERATGKQHGSLMGILRTPKIGQTYRELIIKVPKNTSPTAPDLTIHQTGVESHDPNQTAVHRS